MPLSRTVVNVKNDLPFITYLFSEKNFQSPWSHPNVPVIVFADSALPGFSVSPHGGPVGSGMPVEVLFWGDWWTTAEGVDRRNLLINRTQALLASDYFSELKQYGIDKPHWRGAKIVTEPGPLAAFNSNDDIQSVPDLIDDLIDDDVFPDPDDEKIAFMVFMAKGFTQSIGANGSHTKDYNYTFPWDKDWYWVAWVRSFGAETGEDPEDAMRTFSHELVEMLSDPEIDGWYANNDPQKGEIGDAAFSGNVRQTAWVNGAHVSSYWSNQYGATVIPIDRDYRARILGTIKLERRDIVHGTFRPDPAESRLCELLPECCFEDREYKYTLAKRDELVRLSVETERYRQPQFAWFVENTPIMGDTVLTLNVIAGTYVGRKAKYGPMNVNVQCKLLNNELTLRTIGTEANFDLSVNCKVTDGSITGNVKINVIANPTVTIGFVGEEITVDPMYENQKQACTKAAARFFKDLGKTKPKRKVKIGDPIEFGSAILNDVPAWARVHGYQKAREAVNLSKMATEYLPEEQARMVIAALVADAPALEAAMHLRSGKDTATSY
ncbi:MAG: hypothetical protein WKG06_32285 [Segetibacter sp.]